MQGHTNKATINARRPLTPGMRKLLETVVQKGRLQQIVMTGVERNIMRGLLDRGYVDWHIEWRGYSATDAGREALVSSHHGASHEG